MNALLLIPGDVPKLHWLPLLQTPVPPFQKSFTGDIAMVDIWTSFGWYTTCNISPLPMFRPLTVENTPLTKPPDVMKVKVLPTAGKKLLIRLTSRVPVREVVPVRFSRPNCVP